MRSRNLFLIGGLLAGLALPASAAAQTALVTTDLNMRAGPSPEFPVVATLPEDARVRVHGCLSGYNWCDVTWQGERGWAYGAYLSYPSGGRYVVVSEYGPEIDLPVVTFSVGTYWDRYYRDRPWYGTRSRWVAGWRDRGPRYGYRSDDRDRSERVDRDRSERVDRGRFERRDRDRFERRDRVERERPRVDRDRLSERRPDRDIRGGERLDRRGDRGPRGGADVSGAARVERGGGGPGGDQRDRR